MNTDKKYTTQEIYVICRKYNISAPTAVSVSSYIPTKAELSAGCKAFYISKHRGMSSYYYIINYVNN